MLTQISTYLQTGHRQEPLSQFIWRYDSRSKHCICLQSWPLAGNVIFLKVMGHFKDILMAVCSTPSPSELFREPFEAATELKFLLILVTQCSAGNILFRNKPWSTDLTLGLCTNCRTKRWDWKIVTNISRGNHIKTYRERLRILWYGEC